jgi:hypothetical protein
MNRDELCACLFERFSEFYEFFSVIPSETSFDSHRNTEVFCEDIYDLHSTISVYDES